MGLRAKENTRSGLWGAAWGWGVWFFTPIGGFFDTKLGWDISAILQPTNMEAFVVGSIAALGITGVSSAYFRNQPTGEQVVRSEPVVDSTQRPVKKNWFSDAELDCKCQDLPSCDYRGMDSETLKVANELREQFGVLIVNSGYRCPEHNKNEGGSESSYHLKSKAMDVRSPTVHPSVMYRWLNAKYPNKYGFGNYEKFIHLDTRSDSWARKSAPVKPWRSYEMPDISLD